jgi:hypothetical protein
MDIRSSSDGSIPVSSLQHSNNQLEMVWTDLTPLFHIA